MNQGRPAGLHAQIEDNVIDFEVMRRRIMADRHVSPEEGLELVAWCDRRQEVDRDVAHTLRAVGCLVGGSRGIRSPRFLRFLREVLPDTTPAA